MTKPLTTMTMKFWAAAATAVLSLVAMQGSVHAQTIQAADFIVALVNSEPITDAELQAQIKQVKEQRAQQRQNVPPAAELRSGVLERMISDRAQLQVARDLGLRADPASIDQAEANVAAQSQMDVTQFRKMLEQRGITSATFRSQIADQLVLNRLHEREVESRVRVSDAEVENALAARQAANTDPLAQEINLANLLVALPDNPSAAQVAQAQSKAQALLARIRAGASFESLVKEVSDANRDNGGQIGMRRADRYPLIFVNATQSLSTGQVSEPVRSGAGFHLLKVVARRAASLVQTVEQTHARHILLRLTPQLTQTQALAQLTQLRQRILSGSTSFEAAAREFSQDGSAQQGGDLGWSTPGMFVPEFEEALDRLKVLEIGMPMVSRFGVHLMQVLERRSVELSPAQLRDAMRAELRAKRAEEAFQNWERDIRSRAFVEIREPQ
ncbi:MAG: peptidylprolyl isomerase [Rhodoferax sp.]